MERTPVNDILILGGEMKNLGRNHNVSLCPGDESRTSSEQPSRVLSPPLQLSTFSRVWTSYYALDGYGFFIPEKDTGGCWLMRGRIGNLRRLFGSSKYGFFFIPWF